MLKNKTFWLLLIFASIYILGNIGTGSLSTWDEAIYANVSKEMYDTGIWTALFHRENPWFDKPPLYIWLTAIFYKIFGVNEFSTRLTSSLFGVATIMLMYVAGMRLFNKKTGLLSALILLALPHYLHFAKLGMMDAPLTFFTVLIIYLFWLGEKNPRYLFLSGMLFGIAYLMKGFAAVLPYLILFIFAVLSGKHKVFFSRKFLLGIISGASIALLWHIWQFFVAGFDAVKDYFGFHIFERATKSVQYHTGGINFYQKAIFNKNKPWGVLLYMSGLYMFWQAIKKKDKKVILLCCWIVVTYALYTAVKTKLHWYIMPIYPALAFSSAVFLERFLKNKAFKSILAVILIGMLIQAPISWAFNLDSVPKVKAVADYARKIHLRGEDVYIIGISYAELFYCDFAKILSTTTYFTKFSDGGDEVYCIILPEYLKRYSRGYNFTYTPIYKTNRLSLYKIKFKRSPISSVRKIKII